MYEFVHWRLFSLTLYLVKGFKTKFEDRRRHFRERHLVQTSRGLKIKASEKKRQEILRKNERKKENKKMVGWKLCTDLNLKSNAMCGQGRDISCPDCLSLSCQEKEPTTQLFFWQQTITSKRNVLNLWQKKSYKFRLHTFVLYICSCFCVL